MNVTNIYLLSIFIILIFLLSSYRYLTNNEDQSDTSLNEIEIHPNILKLDMTRSERGIPITEAIININNIQK